MTIYLVRHADAESRSEWHRHDHERPLNRRGREQAKALADRYRDRAVERVLSSPAVRCRQTVAAIAHEHGLEVQDCAPLDEGSPPDEGVALLRSLAGADVVLCSHGDVIPAVVRSLIDAGLPLEAGVASVAKAGTFEIDTAGGALVSVRYVAPPG